MKRSIPKNGLIYGLILWISLSFSALFAGVIVGTAIENTAYAQYEDGGGYQYAIQSQTVITIVDDGYILNISKEVEKSVYHPSDTVRYHIDLSNSGNVSVSSVTVTDTLSDDLIYVSSQPPATQSGQVLSWNLQNIQAGATQGIDFICLVAPDVVSGNSIENRANYVADLLTDQSQPVFFTVETSPELYIEKLAVPMTYRGDTLTYVLAFGNKGDGIAPFTSITDTLPSEIDFITAEGSFNYDEVHHCVTWNIGDILPGTDFTLFIKTVVLDVPINITDISNTASIHSQSIHIRSNTAISDLYSFNMSITADPDTIIGDGTSQSLITVTVSDASGQPAPDGTPISLTTTLGTFLSIDDTLYTVNGSVQNILTASVIDQEYVPVGVEATLLDASGVTDSISVTFCALRIVGIVTDGDGYPVEGAIITIILDGEVIGTDTTGADGVYSIAIYTSGNYIIRIQYPDGKGDYNTVDKDLDINVDDPDQPTTVEDLSSISGHLVDYDTTEPIRIPDIPIVIDYTDNGGLGKGADGELPDTTYTDSTGFWYFNDLELGNYTIRALFDESDGYHITTESVEIDQPGENMVNVDLLQHQILFGAYKTVDKTQVFGGDTVTYTIVYQTMEYAVTDTISILDLLPEGLELIESSLNYSDAFESHYYDPINHELFLYRIGMSPETIDSISFKTIVDEDIISLVNNEAIVMNSADTAYTADNDSSSAETLILTPFMTATKSVNRSVAETGDILTYSIKIENRSEAHTLYGMTVYDQMPRGFRYKENRSFLNNMKVDDPEIMMSDLKQSMTWTLSDTLEAGESMILKYRVIVGLESRIGENINSAQAVTRMYDDYDVWSNVTEVDVIVKPGMIQARGLIFGKVYYDHNGNLLHDNDEETLKDIEIITEEGIRVITDEYGKYSIPNVRMGDHVLRVNEATLPENTEISLSSSDFLGDSRSRLVKVSYSGIAKANFPITTLIEPEPEPIVEIIPEPVIIPVDTVDEREAIVELAQRSLTESMRLIVNDSWSMMLNYDYTTETGSFSLSDTSNMDKTVNFLKWQTQMQVKISEEIELSNAASFSFGQVSDKPTTPANLVFDYLKAHGIDEDRIYLDDTLTIERHQYNLIKSCQVELLLLPEDGLYVPKQALTMEHKISYSGELPIEQASLLTSIPAGFNVDGSSAELDTVNIAMEMTENDMVRWELGEMTEEKEMILIYDLIPVDPPNIRRATKVISYVELIPPSENTLLSASMNTNIPTRVEMIKFDVTLEGALFDVGSYVLKQAAINSIKEIGNFMVWKTDVNILVEGFTDHTGSEESNLILSQNRANSVRDYLIMEFNISPDRIETAGYGEEFPVADNNTREGRALNRRVEIIMNSNFIQKGKELDPVLKDEMKLRVENKKLEILNEELPQIGM
ncbi:MAG: OmpA family protein [Candidatus Marinimicrobia bacterium]|nr:OmpA family protein [Candidatus Neomarinimicrobiota bacterium]